MLPKTQPPPPQNSTKVNLLISFAFHAAIILALVYFAAREGLLGTQLKKITIQMVKEKPPEKPKEPEKPKIEPSKIEPPKVSEVAKIEPPKIEPKKETAPAALSPATATPPAVAPPPADLPSFEFGGGKSVQTSSDPVLLYNSAVEFALRSHWRRPANIEDDSYVAEVEVAVDSEGRLSDPVWKKNSGDARWDQSVREAISVTKNLDRPPPANFPARVLVRFDVQEVTDPIEISQ